jgi:hypothetical protein
MTQTALTNASNNDIYVDANGNLAWATQQAAVKQACENVSRASLGEEVFSINNGIPFFQAVFVGVPNIPVFEAYLRAAILSVPGVIQIESLTTTLNGGTLSYSAVIQNQFGEAFTLAQEFPL